MKLERLSSSNYGATNRKTGPIRSFNINIFLIKNKESSTRCTQIVLTDIEYGKF
jgi:hypothetical protein